MRPGEGKGDCGGNFPLSAQSAVETTLPCVRSRPSRQWKSRYQSHRRRSYQTVSTSPAAGQGDLGSLHCGLLSHCHCSCGQH